jgi:ADP-L-glycero-D-manno-heptose 6-epimerase
MDKKEFRRALEQNALGIPRVSAILHQGACSNTLVDDGVYMMDNNFIYSKLVLQYPIKEAAPLV